MSDDHNSSLTPLMQQYFHIKRQYADALVLFQVGDFYELFYDDAKKAAACLAIALTARGKNNGDPIPLCGVPVHALDHYLTKLIRAGFKVALCNQLEPATPGKVVARGVAQVFTPGTLTDTKLLDAKSASYLLSFFPGQKSCGLLFGEVMTAQLVGTMIDRIHVKTVEAELSRFFPDEILVPTNEHTKEFSSLFLKWGYYVTPCNQEMNAIRTYEQFNAETNAFFTSNELMQCALQQFFGYLQKNHVAPIEHFRQFQWYTPEDFLLIDPATQRNLELVKNSHDGSRKNTLFEIMDGATTAMGSRTIKKWILRPLLQRDAIEQRQDVVERGVLDVALSQQVRVLLQQIGDAERVIGKIILSRAAEHDYKTLLRILMIVPQLCAVLQSASLPLLLTAITRCLYYSDALLHFLKTALNTNESQEWIIAAGFDQMLDSMRIVVEKSTALMVEFEKKEQERTGISSLKVRYTSIHGYYIEITKANMHLVPDDYIRLQTLVGKERFTTLALKKLEAEITDARLQIEQREKELFDQVKAEVASHVTSLRKMAQGLAQLDALFGLAYVSYCNGYKRPTLSENSAITIAQGKHPVVAHELGNAFIPNDTDLNSNKSLWIITGPNMGGKSTYLRQVALIAIMAQCGSFVPAQEAQLMILDKIFTRIGSGDNLAGGKSTFLVEMEETAFICTQATPKSLIIFDEVGRGTSTFDGLAIAQGVVEYVYTIVKAFCLFATHYHELTALSTQFPGIACYHAASRKTKDGITLLYTIKEGHADGSFGIDVAKIACMPATIIHRAQELLELLQAGKKEVTVSNTVEERYNSGKHECVDALLQELRRIDYEQLSPKQAFDILWKIKERIT